MRPLILLWALAVLLLGNGCAWYEITPISADSLQPWGTRNASPGYIIYKPELYFAATISTVSNKQEVSVAPLFLPNPAMPYRVRTGNFLAKADFAFNFENGWKLTQVSDKSDNTTIA